MYPYPVIIEQIEGSDRRRVELAGSALPEESFDREMNLRLVRTDYPGASVPTIHVLGHSEEPIILAGLLSDRETGVARFADSARAAIEGLWRDARVCRLIYRTVSCRALIRRVKFVELDAHEIRYEIEAEVIAQSSERAPVAAERDAFTVVNTVAQALADAETQYEALPEEIRLPPPEWKPDPWLEFRLKMEELHAKAEFLLVMIGNEKALNMNDRVVSTARAGWTTANLAREAMEEAQDGGALGLADALTRSRMVYGTQNNIDSVGLALGL